MSSGHSRRENMPEDRSAAMTGRGMEIDSDETPLLNGESISPLDTSSPPGSVVTRGTLRLALSELCQLIVEDRSLRRAVIVSTETCVQYSVFRDHRFLVLELRDGAKARYLRLDGSLWASGGAATIAIHALLSPSKELLNHECTTENRQTFGGVLTLGELQHLLRSVSEMTTVCVDHVVYDRFFVLLLQHYLGELGTGKFVEGKMKWFAEHHSQIRETLRLCHNIPALFSLTELLRSLERCRRDYPKLEQSNISEALRLSIGYNASPDYDTARGQASTRKLAINIQSLAEQLDAAVHVAEIRLLREESTELLRKLHGCDPRQYDVEFSRALYHLGTHLCRAGYWDRAERSLREASRLYQGLHNGDSASEDNCAGLALTLLEYAKSLERLERNDEAQRTTRDAIVLCRRLFEIRYGAVATQIPAAVRSYGDFLFGLGTGF